MVNVIPAQWQAPLYVPPWYGPYSTESTPSICVSISFFREGNIGHVNLSLNSTRVTTIETSENVWNPFLVWLYHFLLALVVKFKNTPTNGFSVLSMISLISKRTNLYVSVQARLQALFSSSNNNLIWNYNLTILTVNDLPPKNFVNIISIIN